MPKFLFYAGTGFCLFLALTAAAALNAQLHGAPMAFVALHGARVASTNTAAWAIVVALAAALAVSAILVRMAALLAARNLFGAFLALAAVAATVVATGGVLTLQARMLMLARRGAVFANLGEMHFAAILMLGGFLSLALLALRPYFRIQASRMLSALVFFPLPLFLLILTQDLFVTSTAAPLPAVTPASLVYFAVVALLFLAIAVHCIRHRHMFIELTNLRELLDARVDPRAPGRPIGGVAFDS
jgi:hypothetical protein